jgi:hypothetical protein
MTKRLGDVRFTWAIKEENMVTLWKDRESVYPAIFWVCL